MLKRFVMSICALVTVLCCVTLLPSSGALSSYAATAGYTLNLPTQEQIRAKYKEMNIDTSKSVTYTANYSTSAPYAMGDISDFDRQNALNALNFCRYIAGLPADVELKAELNKYAQAASLVNAANNGSLSHAPSRPSGMSDELYDLGYYGSSKSNLSSGRVNIASNIINGYMPDSDSSNMPMVGHRRWILNPSMKYTGFGNVGRYSATYAVDKSRSETFVGDYIAWPPANMPMEVYKSSTSDYPFSVTLGNAYDKPDISKVTVDIRSAMLNKSWHLDKTCTGFSKYLNVENSGYGVPKCIIFNVGMFSAGDTVTVTINGITKGGVSAPITYTVNFFEINHTHKYTSTVTKAATCTTTGVKTYTCSTCGDTYTETIMKTGHNYSFAWTTDKAATCTAEGSKSHHCTVCGEKKDITVIPKTEHKYTSKVTKAATCTETGIETLTCSVCKTTKTQSIAATAHSFGAYKTVTPATTTSEGLEERVCSSCGTKETRTIAKLTASSSSSSSSSSSAGNDPEENPPATDSGENNSSADSENNSSSIDDIENSSSADNDNSSSDSKDNSSSTDREESSSSSLGSSEKSDSDNTSEPSGIGNSQSTCDNGDGGFPIAAGIAIGSVVLVGGIAAFVIVFIRRRKK